MCPPCPPFRSSLIWQKQTHVCLATAIFFEDRSRGRRSRPPLPRLLQSGLHGHIILSSILGRPWPSLCPFPEVVMMDRQQPDNNHLTTCQSIMADPQIASWCQLLFQTFQSVRLERVLDGHHLPDQAVRVRNDILSPAIYTQW